MKKSKKFIIGLVLLAVGIIGIFGLIADPSVELFLGSSVFIDIGVVLLWLDKKSKNTTDAPPTQATVTAPTTPAPKKSRNS